MIDSLVHTCTIRVRYADTDKMGVVYNGNYLTYFEVGRTELLRSLGLPYAEMEAKGIQLPVLEAFVKYKSPAYYDDLLSITATCIMERGLLLKISYSIFKENTLITEGYTVHPFINSESLKPIKPPGFFMELMHSIGNDITTKKDISL